MSFEYGYSYRPPGRPNNKKKILLAVLIFLSLFVYGVISSKKFKPSDIISPFAGSFNSSVNAVKKFINPAGIDKIFKESFAQNPDSFAVYIKNLKTGEEYRKNETKTFKTASLYKLWVMGAVYKQIESGKIKLDDQITEDIQSLNQEFDIATDEAELTDGVLELDVESAIKQMIVVSNNYAALALTKKIGLQSLEEFVHDEGFAGSSAKIPPSTTASDIALFYEKLYKRKLVSKDADREMMDILKQQQLNDRLPKYLPQETAVAHKTGELDFYKHDAGIVFSPKGDYVIVVLSETQDPDQASEKIADFSKKIYEYFEDK